MVREADEPLQIEVPPLIWPVGAALTTTCLLIDETQPLLAVTFKLTT